MRCRPQIVLYLLILILGGGSMLSACGQKGDLYLPDTKAEEETEEHRR